MVWRDNVRHKLHHVDPERAENEAVELWLWNRSVGIVWQHIPVDSGIHGLWIQEETRTRSNGGRRLMFETLDGIIALIISSVTALLGGS